MTDLAAPWRALNWPNRISILRLLGVPPFVMLLLDQRDWPGARYLAMAVFVAMGFSDALDGYLARRGGQITRLGSILDPLADKALIICAVILLGRHRASVPGVRLPDWVAVSVVGKDLWVVTGLRGAVLGDGPGQGPADAGGQGLHHRPDVDGRRCAGGPGR